MLHPNSKKQFPNRNHKVFSHFEVYIVKRRTIGQAFAGGGSGNGIAWPGGTALPGGTAWPGGGGGGGKPGYSSHDVVAVDRKLIGYSLHPEEAFINNDLLMVWKGMEGDDAFTRIYHRLDKYEEYQVEIVPVELKDEL